MLGSAPRSTSALQEVTPTSRLWPAFEATPPFLVLTISAVVSGPSRTSVAVHRLCVEPALDPGRQRAGAVRVEREVGDRAALAAVRERAVAPGEALRVGAEIHAGEQPRLVEDLPGGAR